MHIRTRGRRPAGLIRVSGILVIVLVFLAAGLPALAQEQPDAAAAPESAAETGMMMKGMGHGKRMGGMQGMHGMGKGGGGHGKCRQGGGHGMQGHKRHGHGGQRWKASLTDAQRQEITALKVAHMKVMLPLKMKLKATQAELVALATADTLDQAALEAKIDDLLWHKRMKMIEKYRFMAAERQVLTAEQRLDFDMAALERVKHGKKGGHGHH